MLRLISIGPIIVFAAQIFEFLHFLNLVLEQFFVVGFYITHVLLVMPIIAKQILIEPILNLDHSLHLLHRNHNNILVRWYRAPILVPLRILK